MHNGITFFEPGRYYSDLVLDKNKGQWGFGSTLSKPEHWELDQLKKIEEIIINDLHDPEVSEFGATGKMAERRNLMAYADAIKKYSDTLQPGFRETLVNKIGLSKLFPSEHDQVIAEYNKVKEINNRYTVIF